MLRQRFIGGMGRFLSLNQQTVLFYRSWVPLKPRLILIMIHGACQHSGLFLELGRYCLQHRIAFYALDLRGFGQSTGKRGHVHSFCEYLDDLDQFIGHIKNIHPDDPVFLLGHSLGGTIVIRYEQERPNCVQGAILSAPALRLRLHIPYYLYYVCRFLSWMTPGLCLELYKWARLTARIPRFRFLFHGRLMKKEADPFSTGQLSIRWITELLANGQQALKQTDNFHVSVLCLCGTDDPLIDPSSIRQFYDSIRVKDKKLLLLPNVKHQILQFDGKEEVFEQIVNWLNEHVTRDIPEGVFS
jgi:lysophospholipase